MPGPANMTPRDVIEEALGAAFSNSTAAETADSVLAALTKAGYVIREQVRMVPEGDNDVGRLRAGWPGPGARA